MLFSGREGIDIHFFGKFVQFLPQSIRIKSPHIGIRYNADFPFRGRIGGKLLRYVPKVPGNIDVVAWFPLI